MGYALIAGISYADALRLRPGFIIDLYIARQKYDEAFSVRL